MTLGAPHATCRGAQRRIKEDAQQTVKMSAIKLKQRGRIVRDYPPTHAHVVIAIGTPTALGKKRRKGVP